MILRNTKTILTLVSITFFNALSINSALAQVTENTQTEMNQEALPNIARPNWWVKSKNKKHNHKSKMTVQQVISVKQEPAKNFIKLATNLNWKVMPGPNGIASQRYLLNEKGKQYELAIIRMSAKVPLKAVLQIWQQKAGIPLNIKPEHLKLTNSHDQSFQLVPLDGIKEHYVIAINKINKYTFFRFSSNESISDSMMKKFKIFLTKTVILR